MAVDRFDGSAAADDGVEKAVGAGAFNGLT